MDVTCDRCNTEYEFDDTLVSERGTTVKCTNCGYQFKVRRTDTVLPEAWVVRTVDGRTLEFKMLRELQAAIAKSQITREDVLSRGSSRPRRLGNIAELEPFFRGVGGVLAAGTSVGMGPVPNRPRSPTPQGLGQAVTNEADGAEPDPLLESDTVVMMGRSSTTEEPVPFERSPSAPPPPPSDPATSDPIISEPVASPAGRAPIVPPTPPTPRAEPPGVVVAPEDAPPLPPGYSALAEPQAPPPAAVKSAKEPVIRELDPSDAPTRIEIGSARGKHPSLSVTPTPMDVRGSVVLSDDAYGDPRFSSLAPSRRAGAARWIVGVVVGGLAVLAAVTLVPRYLKPSTATPAQTEDQRVASLLAEGERSLIDGDLETARDKLVKASALAEDDPRVASDLARLETISADLRWLRLRLLAEDDPEIAVAKHELETAVNRARKAVDHAQQLAETDAAVTRSRVDLLRLTGDLQGARKLVGTIASGSAQPENALTLAALDLAEEQPSWPAAIERLKAAASGEQNLGRARAMLIYALARSGDIAGAKAEQERLAAMSRPHPLSGALAAFLERAGPGTADRDAGASDSGAAAIATQTPSAAPISAVASPRPDSRPHTPSSPDDRVPDDFVAPSGGHIDTSDLPGVAAPPSTSTAPPPSTGAAPPPTTTTPPQIDTSDLPGFNKNE